MLGNPGEMGRAKTDANAEKVRGIERPCYIAPMIFTVCKNARPEQSLAQDIMLYRVAFPHISSHEKEEKRGKKAFNKKIKILKKFWVPSPVRNCMVLDQGITRYPWQRMTKPVPSVVTSQPESAHHE